MSRATATLLAQHGEVVSEKSLKTRKKVTRTIEVPYIRKVRVPVTIEQIVPCDIVTEVTMKKHVYQEDFEEVEEKYTEMEQQHRTREKKILVPRQVTESYTEMVPEKRSRVVTRKGKKIVEELVQEIVQVPATKVVEEKGYRIDEIEEWKTVEIEEWELYRLVPQRINQTEKGSVHAVGSVSQKTVVTAGTVVYSTDDQLMEHQNIEVADPRDGVVVYTGRSKQASDRTSSSRQGRTTTSITATSTTTTTSNRSNVPMGAPEPQDFQEDYLEDYNVISTNNRSKSAPLQANFNLARCLEYVRAYLKVPGLDADRFISQLSAHYKGFRESGVRKVHMSDGVVSLAQVKTAVWYWVANNAGKPVPSGADYPRNCQEIVDDISRKTGKDPISFWDYVHYLLWRNNCNVQIPLPREAWAGRIL